jgi:hypothetical protein
MPQNLALRPAVADLDDEALIAAIPPANLGVHCSSTEAARRRLAAAIPALEALCRRFAGFGIDRVVTEQSAVLRALAVIGGRDAPQALSRLIARGVVQGPALGRVVAVAAQRRHGPTPIISASAGHVKKPNLLSMRSIEHLDRLGRRPQQNLAALFREIGLSFRR